MTNESTTAVAPPAPVMPASDSAPNAPAVQDIDAMLERLKSLKGSSIADEIEKLLKKAEKDAEKDAAAAQEKAIAEHKVEFIGAISDTAKDAIPTLGIVIPEKGLKFLMEITRASDGSPMVSITDAQKPRKVADGSAKTGGTRAAAGTGAGSDAVTQISGLSGFILADGSEVRTASQVTKHPSVNLYNDHPSDNQGRVLVGWARRDAEAANKVKAVINGKPVPLADAVNEAFPPKAAEAPAAPVAAS